MFSQLDLSQGCKQVNRQYVHRIFVQVVQSLCLYELRHYQESTNAFVAEVPLIDILTSL